ILLHFFGTANLNYSIYPPNIVDRLVSFRIRFELGLLIKFYMAIIKSAGYPIGLLLQILTIIYLVRGNSGYSRSARNWFLIVLSADISSILYRLFDLMTVDYNITNPFLDVGLKGNFGQLFMALMWGLRRAEDAHLQDVFCKVFFIILYFPIHLSPIALTVSSLIRCYCVKFPLRAKAVLTTRVDRLLMLFTVVLSLGIAIIIGMLVIESKLVQHSHHHRNLLFIGLNFMLAVVFLICAFNILSAVAIIMVLFEAKRNRKSMSANESTDSKAEVRATAMLLGMNVTLFICFFMSRLLAVLSNKVNLTTQPIEFLVFERMSSYLFDIPYYTNALFIAGFTRKFYEFYLPRLLNKEMKTASAISQKTMEESKMG
uniref:G_PROTEIN_RECEP_F1_2 domain-containing protein n=1 Tax=Macrostomum lignano TaxID=282301 RepID=A0A1I8II43_9PLAT